MQEKVLAKKFKDANDENGLSRELQGEPTGTCTDEV